MDTFNADQMPDTGGAIGKKSNGPLLAVIIILLLIIVGGMYFLGQRLSEDGPLSPDQDEITASLEAQSSSDELQSIEADLNATEVDNLDQGAAAFEAEMQ